MLLTVHDELVLEVPESTSTPTTEVAGPRRRWSSVTELRVPLTVDTGFGPNWAAAK